MNRNKKKKERENNEVILNNLFINVHYCNNALKVLFGKQFNIGKRRVDVTIYNSLKYPNCNVLVKMGSMLPSDLLFKVKTINPEAINNFQNEIILPVSVWKRIYSEYLLRSEVKTTKLKTGWINLHI
jgi:hypothetical protein